MVNIAVDAKVTTRKVKLQCEALKKEQQKKVKERFFMRSSGTWEERERDQYTKYDQYHKKKLLMDVLEQDAANATRLADAALLRLLETVKTGKMPNPFSEAALNAMAPEMKQAMQRAWDAQERSMVSVNNSKKETENETIIAKWYAFLIDKAQKVELNAISDLEKKEAEKLAAEQARGAQMELDEVHETDSPARKKRQNNPWRNSQGRLLHGRNRN